jgi:D-glycero-D-manno-heptose 1,7-bisphosphate phosphatase
MKLVIMDRDGTINADSTDFIKTPDEWVPLPGALEAIARLNHAGWHVVVATNQSGLGRGLFDVASLNAMHAKMHKQLALVGGKVDAIFYCPHTPDDHCNCRKPATGLFEQIGERFGIDLKGVPVVGDSLRDVVAGAAAGCEPHLVHTGHGAAFAGVALPPSFPPGTQSHADLSAFASFVLQREKAAKAVVE